MGTKSSVALTDSSTTGGTQSQRRNRLSSDDVLLTGTNLVGPENQPSQVSFCSRLQEGLSPRQPRSRPQPNRTSDTFEGQPRLLQRQQDHSQISRAADSKKEEIQSRSLQKSKSSVEVALTSTILLENQQKSPTPTSESVGGSIEGQNLESNLPIDSITVDPKGKVKTKAIEDHNITVNITEPDQTKSHTLPPTGEAAFIFPLPRKESDPESIETQTTNDTSSLHFFARRSLVKSLRSSTPPLSPQGQPTIRRSLNRLGFIDFDPFAYDMSFNLNALRDYALIHGKPSALIASNTVLTYSNKFIVIFDKYPKAKYHFLIIPRHPYPGAADLRIENMKDLATLLIKGGDARRLIIEDMAEMAREVDEMIRDEMMKTEGFEWGVNFGFHAVPSMPHIHLHVISDDLISTPMKTKKHYNSFVPDFGFFVALTSVQQWLEQGNEDYIVNSAKELKNSKELLAGPLECFKCQEGVFANMPKLKEHLEEEFQRAKRKAAKGRASMDL